MSRQGATLGCFGVGVFEPEAGLLGLNIWRSKTWGADTNLDSRILKAVLLDLKRYSNIEYRI